MSRIPGRILALPLVAAIALGAICCSDPPAAEEPCSGATCGGGTGGAGGEATCPDHAAQSACRWDGAGDSCSDGVCTLSSERCPGGERCCTLGLACQDPVGQRAGGTRCEDDAGCASGQCIEVAGVRSCLRVCAIFSGSDSCPPGQHCETLSLAGGASTTTCVGGTADDRQPEQTICTKPGQCPPERPCRIFNGEATGLGTAVALCLPPVATDDWLEACPPPVLPDGSVDVATHGAEFSAQCEAGGLCWDGCRGWSSSSCYCSEEMVLAGSCRGYRCTGLCGVDDDCPDRLVCQSLLNLVEPQDPALSFAICRFPDGQPIDWGCWDELDCCRDGKRDDGGPCCSEGEAHGSGACASPPVPADATHCRFTPRPGRYVTVCDEAIGLSPLGAACAGPAACASGLCLDDGAGALACASPCDLRFDRCGDVQPGTVCCPTQVEAEGESHCVPACRAGCESPPACEP